MDYELAVINGYEKLVICSGFDSGFLEVASMINLTMPNQPMVKSLPPKPLTPSLSGTVLLVAQKILWGIFIEYLLDMLWFSTVSAPFTSRAFYT